MPAASTLDTKSLRHETFCLPRPGEKEPRVEGYVAYEDDARTGLSRPSVFVTRCLECGATSQRPIND